MIVNRDNVLRILQDLDGSRSLRNLFVRELGCDPEALGRVDLPCGTGKFYDAIPLWRSGRGRIG